jgi:exopolysaccharide production protein ExoZ
MIAKAPHGRLSRPGLPSTVGCSSMCPGLGICHRGLTLVSENKLDGLQVARAVAALSIAYFHSWTALVRFPKDAAYPIQVLADHGHYAVDLFFAISGFVICLVVSRPAFGVASFLTKQVFRLYPLWLLMLTAFAVLSALWRGPTPTETPGYFLYSATLLPTQQYPFYDLGWTLQHEMAFYLVAAIVVPMFGIIGLAVFLATAAVASHLIAMPWYFSNIAFYYPEFLVGVLAFMARPKLAFLGSLAPIAIGFLLLWYFAVVWGGRPYISIACFC